MKKKEIAAQVGIRGQYLTALLSGKTNARIGLAHKLEKVTGVKAIKWIDPKYNRREELKNPGRDREIPLEKLHQTIRQFCYCRNRFPEKLCRVCELWEKVSGSQS